MWYTGPADVSESDEQATLQPRDTGESDELRAVRRVGCLTIVHHPDATRVGDRRLLLARSRPYELSRNELTFTKPGTAAEPRPLEDPYLSREPLGLSVVSHGALRLSMPAAYQAMVDGAPAPASLTLDARRLEKGVLVELSKRVLLWLHLAYATRSVDAHGLDGESCGVDDVRRAIGNVGDLDVPVLVRGETGVGKDRVARAIHAASRREGPYLAVNAAVLARSTAASELFGHAKGAFTDAHDAHRGLFEAASGGTLFLDEIGELASDVQALLLRTLETGTVRPLGSSEERAVQTRVVAATDADLEELAEQGELRPALLHRLAGFSIEVPALRDRPEDIARLAMHFLREELEALGQADRLELRSPEAKPWLSRRIMARLLRYEWPGNVRQLRNVARRIAIGSRDAARATLDESLDALVPPERAAPQAAADAPPTEARLLAALEENGWAFGPAARALGLNRTTFYRLVENHPEVRKGTDLHADELRAALEANAGDLDATSRALRVSRRAIKLRMRELGMAP